MKRIYLIISLALCIVLSFAHTPWDGLNIKITPFFMDSREISLSWYIYLNAEIFTRCILTLIVVVLTKERRIVNDIAMTVLGYYAKDIFTFNFWYNDYDHRTDLVMLVLIFTFVIIFNKYRINDL